MTIDDIKTLIATGESQTLELKKSTGELKDGMHSACAFLNTAGGWLIFGITPKSLKIVGQEVTDNTRREIAQAIAGLEPAVDVKVEYIDVPDYPDHKVVAMHFDGRVWGKRPHTFHGCPYYKVESTTKIMPQDMYDERIRAHQPHVFSWELQTAAGVTLADLNEKHIRGCIRLGVEGGRIPASAMSAPIEDTLSKWMLLNNGVPTNGAAMLFSDNIDHYPQFRLRMARFFGTDKNEFIDNQRAEGNFFGLLDAGMAFLFKHLNLSGKITNHSLQREEHLEVPYPALREALINSLCHRQWEKHNLTNSIAIYDDRIEIANPGVFPPQITPESIKKTHESYPYNLKMAETLYKSTYLENWGTGARRIMEACRAQGVDDPVWRWDGGFVIVTFKRPQQAGSVRNVSDGAIEHRSTSDPYNATLGPNMTTLDPNMTTLGPNMTTLGPNMTTPDRILNNMPEDIKLALSKIGKRSAPALLEEIVVELCKIMPLNIEQLSELTHRSADYLRKFTIRKLVREKRIRFTIPEMINHPEQKYQA